VGTEGEGPPTPFTADSTTQRMPSKKTARMGDKAKPLVSWAGGFAVFEAAFLCGYHFAKSRDAVRCMCAMTLKAGDRPPYGQRAQTSASTLQGYRGSFFPGAPVGALLENASLATWRCSPQSAAPWHLGDVAAKWLLFDYLIGER
jgi:hypothetical protein